MYRLQKQIPLEASFAQHSYRKKMPPKQDETGPLDIFHFIPESLRGDPMYPLLCHLRGSFSLEAKREGPLQTL